MARKSKGKRKPRTEQQTAAAKIGLEILQRPSISPEQLHMLGLMPVSRNGIYDACNRGEIESFKLGRKIVIPTAPLRRKLGMEA